ncbi:MAG: pyridoxine 5'-phosphate synthase [Casimicrobiaceae bacterium]|nr:pyridoxine 5'-phosphate synthase [Casimicrobiaceae bacterium]MCX8098949.1 pyridoxine 5'-phosphate synthase [Casimicrobiaceae bacterium]MDW8313138.1 pyridoxine 5'-phosphate synthase [Burkholderiales bacterium]
MAKLSVNVNRVALLRNSRDHGWTPDLIMIARRILEAGAHGITVHPRPDERHIRASDVAPMAAVVAAFPGREYNIEGNPEHNLLAHVHAVRPTQATFVPDAVGQKTSDHGYAPEHTRRIAGLVAEARQSASRVSLFVDPDPAAIDAAAEAGAQRVELYTEPYARAFHEGAWREALPRYVRAAEHARRLGLGVNAGHDLNLDNLPAFIAEVEPDEVSIGHALIADALLYGIAETVERYLRAAAGQG